MADNETAEQVLAELRDADRLGSLLRRPRCADGSLDKRCKANRGLSKDALVTDYYDPEQPAVNIEEAVIEELRRQQQERFDALCFKDLTAQVAQL